MDSLKNRIVCITGASSGMGAETARVLAKYGARLAIHGRNKDRLEAVAKECRQLGGLKKDDVFTVYGDIEDAATPKKIVKKVLDHFKTIHVLVNNAGQVAFGSSTDTDRKVLEKMMNQHLYTPTSLTQLFVEQIIKNKGSIVNVSSVLGYFPTPVLFPYQVAKAAMVSMSNSFALDLAKHGVSVNSVCPGWTKTELLTGSVGMPLDQNYKFWDSLDDECASGKVGNCSDIAETIAFLASGAAPGVNGQNIMVDGGNSLALATVCNTTLCPDWCKAAPPKLITKSTKL